MQFYAAGIGSEASSISIADSIPSEAFGPWHILRTRSRQEKALAADLEAMGMGCYLPRVRVARQYGSQRVHVELPLFPGYLFMRGSIDDTYAADRTRRVAQIIRVADQPRLEWELRNLALVLSSDEALDPYPHLRCGVRVEVRSGPLRGVQGLIVSRGQRDRLVLQVDMLGQGVSLELDGALLDVID
jgi:transcription antitermination factor NusG